MMEKHMTAGAMIVTQESPRRILLVHHNKLGVWISPGGHAEANENPYETAVREVREETGIDITPYLAKPCSMGKGVVELPLPFKILEELIPAYGDKPSHHHIGHMYLAYVPFQEVKHDPNESGDIRWITEDELDSIETFGNRREIMKEVFRNE